MGARLTVYLVDTSVWHRRQHPDVLDRWTSEVNADRIATTGPVRMEILYSAQAAKDYDAISAELDGLIQLSCGDAAMARALDVQRLLAHHRPLHHRSVRIPDLLIAASAELARATVLHYDEDFDRVAEQTGQPVEWIVPRGSI